MLPLGSATVTHGVLLFRKEDMVILECFVTKSSFGEVYSTNFKLESVGTLCRAPTYLKFINVQLRDRKIRAEHRDHQ